MAFPPPQPRLLLVNADPAWTEAARGAAALLGADIDVLADVHDALVWMLRATRIYTHLLATLPLTPAQRDTLAGMGDEGAGPPMTLLLLGGDAAPDSAAIAQAVRDHPSVVPAAGRALSQPEFRAALQAGWLRMRFQPILLAASLAPVGLEALARLHHPDLGILHPRDFMQQAIAHGQEASFAGITAARTMLELHGLSHADWSSPLDGLTFGLNMPLAIFCAEQATERARHLCEAAMSAPQRIVIELVETPTMPDLGVLGAAVARWRAAGFGLAIDDAGPALPHWRALLGLGFSMLKLDGRLGGDPANLEFAATVTAAAQAQGMRVVAEGIEDEAALRRMRALGVDSVQGFLFSRPLPALAVPVWLEEWRARLARA